MAAKNQNTVVSATQKIEPGAKKDALATALAQIEKQFGKGAVMKLGDNTAMQVDAISTGSLGLDMALGVGGVPRGRIIEVYGPESSGKTTLSTTNRRCVLSSISSKSLFCFSFCMASAVIGFGATFLLLLWADAAKSGIALGSPFGGAGKAVRL